MTILDLSDAKALLRITVDTEDAAVLETIAAAVTAVEGLAGPLEQRSGQVQEVTANIAGRAAAPIWPVISVDSGVSLDDGSALTVADVTVRDGGILAGLPPGQWRITCTVGRPTVPAHLMEAVRQMVAHLYQARRGPGRRAAGNEEQPQAPGTYVPALVRALVEQGGDSQPGFA